MNERQKKTTKCPSFAVFAVGPSVPDPLRLCREVCADKLAGAMDGIATKVDLPGGTVVVAVRSEVDAVLATDIAARLGRSADEIDFERRRLENLYRGIYEDQVRDANRAAPSCWPTHTRHVSGQGRRGSSQRSARAPERPPRNTRAMSRANRRRRARGEASRRRRRSASSASSPAAVSPNTLQASLSQKTPILSPRM